MDYGPRGLTLGCPRARPSKNEINQINQFIRYLHLQLYTFS